jgi:hypothetical protein
MISQKYKTAGGLFVPTRHAEGEISLSVEKYRF